MIKWCLVYVDAAGLAFGVNKSSQNVTITSQCPLSTQNNCCVVTSNSSKFHSLQYYCCLVIIHIYLEYFYSPGYRKEIYIQSYLNVRTLIICLWNVTRIIMDGNERCRDLCSSHPDQYIKVNTLNKLEMNPLIQIPVFLN